MSARHKLNSASVLGAIVVAALAGAVTQSWSVFWLGAAVLIALSLNAGDIRLPGRRS